MDGHRTNHPTLNALRHMPVSDIIALPAEHLALLQTDAREALDAAKRMQDWIEAAIALRYEQRAVGARAAAGKDSVASLKTNSLTSRLPVHDRQHGAGRWRRF